MRNKKNSGLMLVLPALLGFLTFYFVPFLITIWYSFSFGIGAREFVGFENYKMILENDLFLLAAGNTLRFMATGIPMVLALSFFLALLFKIPFRGERFFRLSFLYPLMLPVASVVMVVRVVFEENGMLNSVMFQGNSTDWVNSKWAFWIMVLLFLWKNMGYHILIFFSGLQMIPKEYYESARLDGAGSIQCFGKITFPLMLPILGFNFLLAMMNSFKCFREAFLIGGTHPHESIYLLQHFMNNNFENLNYQRISVTSVLMFLVVACVGVSAALIYRQGRKAAR